MTDLLPMLILLNRSFGKILDYWAGKGIRPTEQEAKAVLMELAENVKIEKCSINYGVLQALFSKK